MSLKTFWLVAAAILLLSLALFATAGCVSTGRSEEPPTVAVSMFRAQVLATTAAQVATVLLQEGAITLKQAQGVSDATGTVELALRAARTALLAGDEARAKERLFWANRAMLELEAFLASNGRRLE